ncbi:hypothetical protein GOB46_22890 [Sinorhizobium meliloti]|nr:hypothetical protein [Sinorhizobium meliloti]MDW9873387.1 hypothetical protein [Sinorhizobium meliloti]MDW9885087.1 hypothetical protein [Sinorhizobium meliloti]
MLSTCLGANRRCSWDVLRGALGNRFGTRRPVFAEPVLVADVEYRAWADDGKLRHASFKGIRERRSKIPER